ncbi:hypothetical protein FRC17_009481 [Serendipita sp. 399]|nr:hypothetical protein FRC17_009481 [Serendipita sp. 399]
MSDNKVAMSYVRLGKSGLKVSKIILGCMSYGKKSWADWVLDEEEGIKHITQAFKLGINTFDTANLYSLGESERILGKAMKAIGAPRSSFVILTKVFFPVPPEDAPAEARNDPEAFNLPNYRGLSRKHIFESIKASLERLQTDYVDVLQCHRFDPDTPIEETMQALHDVVQAGYARYIGMSSCHAWQFHMMQNYAINNRLTPFISMQNYHSLVYREEEREMNPLCEWLGVGTIPWSPLSRGVLTRPRKDKDSTHRAKTDEWFSFLQKTEDPNIVIVDRVEEIANKKGISMTQVALAWLMQKSPVAAPIVGTTNIEHLLDMIIRLGKSGLKVSKIILGCMSYGKKSWADWVLDEEEGIKQITEAFKLGINVSTLRVNPHARTHETRQTFDTANVYSLGESERILGKAMKAIGAPRSSFVVLTKVFFAVPPEGAPAEARNDPEAFNLPNYRGLSRKHIFESIKASLERLQTDYVDVLQCHRFDPNTPIEETMQALHDVVKAGYARYIGMSSCHAWQFHMMQNYAINNKLTPFISMQNYHSLVYREEEREMNPLCEWLGVGTIPWSPLSRGILTRPRKDKGTTLRAKTDRFTSMLQKDEDPNLVVVDRVEEIASKKGISMAQVALAWVMQKSPVAAPIVGTTNMEHLLDMIKAVNVKLDEEEIKYLEECYTSKPVVGH